MNAKKAIITLSVLLGLSVCGNAFLGGLALSHGPFGPPHMMRGGPDFAGPDRDGPPGARGAGPENARFRGGLRDFVRDMPPDVRQPILEAFKGHREEMGDRIKLIGDARKSAMDVLQAEQFDADKLREALAAQRAAQLEMQTSVHERLIGVIATLTPEQRRELAGSTQRLFK